MEKFLIERLERELNDQITKLLYSIWVEIGEGQFAGKSIWRADVANVLF